jgi:hypothetical protein
MVLLGWWVSSVLGTWKMGKREDKLQDEPHLYVDGAKAKRSAVEAVEHSGVELSA